MASIQEKSSSQQLELIQRGVSRKWDKILPPLRDAQWKGEEIEVQQVQKPKPCDDRRR